MAAEREPPTATDYVVTALSPVLVMLMVGSLVFFLVEVLYEGRYSGRLLYTLFFFVAGAVLVARIAIETDASRASLYGALLGGATYLALLAYVEYPGGGWMKSFGWLVNLGLMCLIWWSAHKLTWDCTHIDEKRKGAGRGLLSAAGLDAGHGSDKPLSRDPKRNVPEANPERKRAAKKPKHHSRLWDWIERYKKDREAKRAIGHTPGVWVVYFALAALPLFALGQSLIRPDDAARRQATFLQMVVYVGSALALLVTTSLLGLRRYLRQRKAKIPTALAGGWLALGGVFIVVFLALGAFLPRPHSEVPWFGIARAGKSERDASRHAVRKSGGGEGEGAAGDQTRAGDGNTSGKNGKPGGGNSGEKGSGSGDKSKGGGGKKGDQSGGDQKGAGKGNGGEEQANKDESGTESGGREGADSEGNPDGDSGRERSSGSQTDTQLGGMLEKVAEVVKWLVYAVVVVLVVIVVVLAVLRHLAPFTTWAQRLLDALRNWWASLWGQANGRRESAGDEPPAGPERPPPFQAFANPFTDGSADGRSPQELVAYTFLAFDSWAWDRGQGREVGETPLEFISRLAGEFPDLLEVLERFGKVYSRVSYSDAPPPRNTLAVLEETWDGLVHGVGVA